MKKNITTKTQVYHVYSHELNRGKYFVTDSIQSALNQAGYDILAWTHDDIFAQRAKDFCIIEQTAISGQTDTYNIIGFYHPYPDIITRFWVRKLP